MSTLEIAIWLVTQTAVGFVLGYQWYSIKFNKEIRHVRNIDSHLLIKLLGNNYNRMP